MIGLFAFNTFNVRAKTAANLRKQKEKKNVTGQPTERWKKARKDFRVGLFVQFCKLENLKPAQSKELEWRQWQGPGLICEVHDDLLTDVLIWRTVRRSNKTNFYRFRDKAWTQLPNDGIFFSKLQSCTLTSWPFCHTFSSFSMILGQLSILKHVCHDTARKLRCFVILLQVNKYALYLAQVIKWQFWNVPGAHSHALWHTVNDKRSSQDIWNSFCFIPAFLKRRKYQLCMLCIQCCHTFTNAPLFIAWALFLSMGVL